MAASIETCEVPQWNSWTYKCSCGVEGPAAYRTEEAAQQGGRDHMKLWHPEDLEA